MSLQRDTKRTKHVHITSIGRLGNNAASFLFGSDSQLPVSNVVVAELE